MASIKVVLMKQKIQANGESPIMLRIIKERKVSYKSLGVTCKAEYWDEKKSLPNKKHPNRVELETLISKKIADAQKLILSSEIGDKKYSAKEIIDKTKKASSKVTVFNYFDETIARFLKANKIGNADTYKDTKRVLSKFRAKKDLTFSEMEPSLLNKLEESLLGGGLSESSISVYMRTLRALFNRAIVEGIAQKDDYPFDVYKVSKLNTKSSKRAIDKDLMIKIIKLDLEKETRLWHSRNYFVFSYYNMGLNLIDLAHLKTNCIVNGRLRYNRQKTGKEYNIKILPPAQEIIDQYLKSRSSDYIFPILNDKVHKSPQQIKYRVKKIRSQVNNDLKVIAKRCEIDVNLTTYVARHSWATILKKSGVSTSVISEAMGHDSEKTTQIYLDSFENSQLDEANEQLLK